MSSHHTEGHMKSSEKSYPPPYLRIVASRGYAVDSHELEMLKAEIVEEGAKLERLLRGEA